MLNSSMRTIDRTRSGVTTQGQSGPGSNGNEGVICISQSSIVGASPSDCLSYSGHLGKSYSSAEMQSLYSSATNDWAEFPYMYIYSE